MFKKSTWLHLRIPFSYFLLPIFLFSVSITGNINPDKIIIVLVALHIFLYPASNAFNSYFDKDTKSIGGLKNPPPVSKGLYYLALIFDLIAIGLGLLISLDFAIMLLIYGLISKAYSHPAIRLKKFPIASWLVAGFFQGCFTFVMAYMGINGFEISSVLRPGVIIPGLLTSAILWGSYPMTQIYQHEEDKIRGDITLSYKLGIKGTFYFTAILFSLSILCFHFYFTSFHQAKYSLHFIICMTPVLVYFLIWYRQVTQEPTKADYSHTMWLNAISATCLNVFFIYFFLDRTQIIQALQGGF